MYSIVLTQSPRRVAPNKQRFSGLWEFFYDSDESGDSAGGKEKGRGVNEKGRGVNDKEEDVGKIRNIRGFLFKRRKSPLKGWHKVGVAIEQFNIINMKKQLCIHCLGAYC